MNRIIAVGVTTIGIALSAVAFDDLANASVIDIGTANTANCLPFSCNFGTPSTTVVYQQVYGANNFTSPILIDELIFFSDPTNPLTTPASGTFNISLSTTSMAVGGLSTTFANNLGADNTTVYNASLPTLTGGELTLALSSDFLYDPTKGNLLMQVTSTNFSAGPLGFLQADGESSATLMSRVFLSGTSGVDDSGKTPPFEGLVTGFDVTPTPLPGALPLFATALGGLGLLGWRRKRKAQALA